jgi:microcystin-dependent protein
MSDPFIGEIRIFGGNFPPMGWALCQGQLLSIAQNTALFAILGTQYGGDGKTTFALPDLRGRVPISQGAGTGLTPRSMGEEGGSAYVTLLTSEMPAHNHTASAVPATGSSTNPEGTVWAQTTGGGRGQPAAAPLYTANSPNTTMSPMALAPAGGSQPHNNMQPYVGMNYIIALQGIFPPRG